MSGIAYYQNHDSIKTIEDVKTIFPEPKADANNWCLLSTSGVHGTYTDLNTIERYYDDPAAFIEGENGGEGYEPKITVLIIRPRIVSMLYGHINVSREDIVYLRELTTSSLEEIAKSQTGNSN